MSRAISQCRFRWICWVYLVLVVTHVYVLYTIMSMEVRRPHGAPGRAVPAVVIVQESDLFLRDNATGRLSWNEALPQQVSVQQRAAKDDAAGAVQLNNTVETADPQLSALSPVWLAARRAVYAKRSLRLLDVCRSHLVGIRKGNVTSRPAPSPLERIDRTHFVTVRALNATVCLLPKVASTTLLSTLLRVTGVGVPVLAGNVTSLHGMSGRLQPRSDQLADRLRRTLTVLLVRHPLRRLVSAYEDKVAATRPSRAAPLGLRRLQVSLLRRYEQLHFGRNRTLRLWLGDPSAEVERDHVRQVQQYRREVLRRGGRPTFSEFVTAALRGSPPLRDAHWTPYWRHCAPCHIGYQLILQLETASDDLPYLWHAMKLYHWAAIPWLHRTERPTEPSLQELADRYLRPLDRRTVTALRAEYKLDFDLFGYDWRSLMHMSGHCAVGDASCELL